MTNFPTGLDSFTNPTAATLMDALPHDEQHSNANDAILALETLVGITGSAVTSTLEYRVTNIPAANITSGTIATARLGAGVADATTFLRGDSTWVAVVAGSQTPWSSNIDAAGFILENASAINNITGLTASRAVVTNGTKDLTSSVTTLAELAFVSGVTSAIQTQLNLKAPLASPTFTTKVSLFTDGAADWNFIRSTNDLALVEDVSSQSFLFGNTGTLSAAAFSGAGSGITSLNATNISSGTLANARLSSAVVITEGVGASALTLTGATQVASFPVLTATQTWNNAAVTFTAIKLNVTNTTSAAASLLMDLQVGGVSQLTVTRAGIFTALSSIISSAGASLTSQGDVATGRYYVMRASRGYLNATADGVWVMWDNAASSFGRLCWGGITSSFPSLKRSNTILQARLADDSAYCPVEADTVRTATAYTVATLPAAGSAGRRAYVTDALAPAFLAIVVGGGAVVTPVFDNGANWVAE